MADEMAQEFDDSGCDFPPSCPSSSGNDDRITLVGLVFETAFGLRRTLLQAVDEGLGISGQAFDILLRLLRSSDQRLRMSDLAAQTSLSPSGLTRAIDRLIEVGYLERTVCANDRRGTFASLTEEGRRRTEEAVAEHRGDIDAILDGLFDNDGEAVLMSLLRTLRDRVRPDAAQVTADEAILA